MVSSEIYTYSSKDLLKHFGAAYHCSTNQLIQKNSLLETTLYLQHSYDKNVITIYGYGSAILQTQNAVNVAIYALFMRSCIRYLMKTYCK